VLNRSFAKHVFCDLAAEKSTLLAPSPPSTLLPLHHNKPTACPGAAAEKPAHHTSSSTTGTTLVRTQAGRQEHQQPWASKMQSTGVWATGTLVWLPSMQAAHHTATKRASVAAGNTTPLAPLVLCQPLFNTFLPLPSLLLLLKTHNTDTSRSLSGGPPW
jgi:hypothetical protein